MSNVKEGAKNKAQVVQPTGAGSNLPASAPSPDGSDLVNNMTVDTTLDVTETKDELTPAEVRRVQSAINISKDQESPERGDSPDTYTFGRVLVQAAHDGRSISDLKKLAVTLIPSKRESAQDYLKSIQRMRGIMEVISTEVYEAVQNRFGT